MMNLLFAGGLADLGHEGIVQFPELAQFLRVFPNAGGQPGQVRCAEGGGFQHFGADDAGVKKIRLGLHEEIIGRCAAVYAQGRKLDAGFLLHGV